MSLLTGARGSSLGNTFWISFTFFGLFCYCHFVIKSHATCDRKADVNQPFQRSVFSPIGACIRIWCKAGAVEWRSQMFVYRPFRFILSPVPRSKASSQVKVRVIGSRLYFKKSCYVERNAENSESDVDWPHTNRSDVKGITEGAAKLRLRLRNACVALYLTKTKTELKTENTDNMINTTLKQR